MGEVIDQILHFMWAFTALVILTRDNLKVRHFVFAALVIALPREFVDQWHFPFGLGKLMDIFFFALGGVAAGWIWKRKNSTQE